MPPPLRLGQQSPRTQASDANTASSKVLPEQPGSSTEAAVARASASSTSASLPQEPFSEPVITSRHTELKADVPSRQPENLARNSAPGLLGNLIVGALFKSGMRADQVHQVGQTAALVYRENLPKELKSLGQSSDTETISSATLVQDLFAEDFESNKGWCDARKVFQNAALILAWSSQGIEASAIDPDLKKTTFENLRASSDEIVRQLLGHPASVKNSPLPERVIAFLVHSDQRFHTKLMEDDHTRNFTAAQMRDARAALQQHLLVTNLLLPMLSELAPKKPSQVETWFLNGLRNGLLKAAAPLCDELLALSFSNSPDDLRNAATAKFEHEQTLAKIEQQRERTEQRKAEFKTKQGGHFRSRSADTTPISARSLPTRLQVQQLRSAVKASEALANEFTSDMENFEFLLNDLEKEFKEKESAETARARMQKASAANTQAARKDDPGSSTAPGIASASPTGEVAATTQQPAVEIAQNLQGSEQHE